VIVVFGRSGQSRPKPPNRGLLVAGGVGAVEGADPERVVHVDRRQLSGSRFDDGEVAGVKSAAEAV
jgi:hypothetical protein